MVPAICITAALAFLSGLGLVVLMVLKRRASNGLSEWVTVKRFTTLAERLQVNLATVLGTSLFVCLLLIFTA